MHETHVTHGNMKCEVSSKKCLNFTLDESILYYTMQKNKDCWRGCWTAQVYPQKMDSSIFEPRNELQSCNIRITDMTSSESMAWKYMPKLQLNPDRNCVTHTGQQSRHLQQQGFQSHYLQCICTFLHLAL